MITCPGKLAPPTGPLFIFALPLVTTFVIDFYAKHVMVTEQPIVHSLSFPVSYPSLLRCPVRTRWLCLFIPPRALEL